MKFKVGDRVAVYSDGAQYTGKVISVKDIYLLEVMHDFGGMVNLYHPKQCRRLVKKKKESDVLSRITKLEEENKRLYEQIPAALYQLKKVEEKYGNIDHYVNDALLDFGSRVTTLENKYDAMFHQIPEEIEERIKEKFTTKCTHCYGRKYIYPNPWENKKEKCDGCNGTGVLPKYGF